VTRCENCGVVWPESRELCSSCGAFASFLPFEAPGPEIPPGLAVLARDLEDGAQGHIPTGFEAWDEVLSGGLVLGSSLVVYGQAGSRKTTWSGAIADHVATRCRGKALFLSAEMPGSQVRDAIARIREPRNVYIIGAERNACNLDACLKEVLRLRPRVVIYDSIQSFDAASAMAGSELAVKTTVNLARRFAAQYRHAAILISQVNKSGFPAGPHRTIHDCDIVAHLEFAKVTIKNKNRYGPTPREAVLP
jgi:predicted ATP-dependent serine protease